MHKQQFTWVCWHGRKAVDIRSAHIALDGSEKTACGLYRLDAGNGAVVIGRYNEDDSPNTQRCWLCMRLRKTLAEQQRLKQWNALSVQQDSPPNP